MNHGATEPHRPALPGDAHDLAVMLDPVLHEASGGRLGSIEWFHSAWQRGGAATGYSTWRLDDGASIDVLVKLPVGPGEHRWTAGLGTVTTADWLSQWALGLPTPRVVAAGTTLGGYDLAWLITERLDGAAMSNHLGEEGATELLRAAADFQATAMRLAPLGDRPESPDWDRALERSRELCREGAVPEGQRWNETIRRVQRALPTLRARWEQRPINAWCHGDVHPGNAMRRKLPDASLVKRGCVLIDLALVHAGHWLEDALYLERQFWGHSDLLGGVKPVPTLAKLRRERGLPADDNYGALAGVRRVLMAACAPAAIDREGNSRYLHAALEIVEKYLPQASR